MKRKSRQNLLETFHTVTCHYLLTENIFCNCFAKNLLSKQLWWYDVFVICKIEVNVMSTLSYQFISFIQQILCTENDVIFLCKT